MAMLDEKELIINEFGTELLRLTAETLSKPENKVFWNEVVGFQMHRTILDTCRCFTDVNWQGDKLIYGVKARMQAGKTKAVFTAVWSLFKAASNDFVSTIYSCSGRKDLETKTRQEINEFLIELEQRILGVTVENYGNNIEVYYDNRCLSFYVSHNTNAKDKNDARRTIQTAPKDDTKIIIWDESDQAFGKGSQRNKFIAEVLGLSSDDDAYDNKSMKKRQDMNLFEISISATGFANTMARQMELQNYSEEITLASHPKYIGLSEIKDQGFLFPAKNICNRNGISKDGFGQYVKVMTSFLNSDESYGQFSRPISLTRIGSGILQHETVFAAIEREFPNLKFSNAIDTEQFYRAHEESDIDVINLFFNNTRDKFGRRDLRKYFTKMALGRLPRDKKINIFIDGTIKEGDDLLNKNSDQFAFFWDRETKMKAPTEARIQSAGRFCGIRFVESLPPLIYSHPKLCDMIDDYIDQGICPSGREIRRGATGTNARYDWAFVSKSQAFSTQAACLQYIEKLQKALEEKLELNSRLLNGRGFELKHHSAGYIRRIYPICREYVENNDHYQNLNGKSTLDPVSSTNRKKGEDQGIIYVHQKDDGNFGFAVVFHGEDRNNIKSGVLRLAEEGLGSIFFLDKGAVFSKPTMMHSAAK